MPVEAVVDVASPVSESFSGGSAAVPHIQVDILDAHRPQLQGARFAQHDSGYEPGLESICAASGVC
jgi:hypothetical protein